MVSAKEELLSKIPEVQKQQERFEEVFGEDTSKQIKKEEETFEKRFRGGRPPSQPQSISPPEVIPSKSISSSKSISPSKVNEILEKRRRLSEANLKTSLQLKTPSKLLKKQRELIQSLKPAQRIETLKYTPISEVSKIKRERGRIERAVQKIEEKRGKLRTKRLRGEKFSIKREVKLGGLAFTGQILKNVIAFKDLPKTAKEIIKDPSKLKDVPSAIIQSGKNTLTLIETSPSEGVAVIGAELLLLKGTSKGFKAIEKASDLGRARLSPKYVGKGKVGDTLKVTTKSGKEVELKVVGRIGSKTLPREKIADQLKLAGRKATPVSVQSDQLVGLIKRKRLLRKPIPNEAKFSAKTKELLSKFDYGKITSKELNELDRLIRKQGEKGILERSFFADPKGRIRPSRIGVEKEASLLDVLTEDISFKSSKPQILVFDKVRVQKFPKNLKGIIKKIKSNQPLTQSEANRFLRFQLKKSGKFKPLGFFSGESEITLAPGEIIKRNKKVGVTIINGKRVNIVEAEVFKPKGKLNKLIKDYERGKLNKKQIKKLDAELKRKTGIDYNLSSKKLSSKKIPIKRLSKSGISRLIRSSKPSKISKISRRSKISKISKTSKPSKSPKSIKPSKPSRGSGSSKPSKPSRVSKPSKPSKTGSPKKPPRIIKPLKALSVKRIRKTKKVRKQIGYDVFGKRKKLRGQKIKKVWIKLNKKPLTKKQALDRGAYAIDNSVARTFRIERIGKTKKLGRITKKESGHYNRTRRKYRRYKIKKGVKKPITRKFIEKRGKALIDTIGEKRGLKLSKIAKQLKSPRPPKRKATSLQLENLRKGREKLMRMRNNKKI